MPDDSYAKSDFFHDVRSIDYPILDADAHVQEPPDLWQARAPAKLKDRAPRVKHTDRGDFWLFDEGKQPEPVGFTASSGLSYLDFHPTGLSYETIRPGMWQPEARLVDMDIDGIHTQILYPSVTLKGASTYSDDRELQLFCVRAYNEWLSEFCADSGGRLIPQSLIPATGLDDAVAELEWALKHDHRGVLISRMPSGDFDFTPEDEPFFARATEAGLPVVVHIGSFLRPNPNLRRFGFTDLPFLGQAGAIKAGSHTLPVACDLLFSGLFEKFPDLDVVLVEANIGWIPTLLEQSDDMFLRYRFFTKPTRRCRGCRATSSTATSGRPS